VGTGFFLLLLTTAPQLFSIPLFFSFVWYCRNKINYQNDDGEDLKIMRKKNHRNEKKSHFQVIDKVEILKHVKRDEYH
jgi:hypothetical protein